MKHSVLFLLFIIILVSGCTVQTSGSESGTQTADSQPPVLYSTDLPNAKTEMNYSKNMCGNPSNTPLNCGSSPATWDPYSGTPPYTFTAAGLPQGLTMRADGLISGIVPESAELGNYSVRVCVTDSAMMQSCYDTNINVEYGCTWTHWTGEIDIPREQNYYGICHPEIEGQEGLQDTDIERMEAQKCLQYFEYYILIDFNLSMKMNLEETAPGNLVWCSDAIGVGDFETTILTYDDITSCSSGYESYEENYRSEGVDTKGTIYFDGLSSITSYLADYYADTETFRAAYFAAPALAKVECYDEFGTFFRVSKDIYLVHDTCRSTPDMSSFTCDCRIGGIGFDPHQGTCTFNRAS